MATDPPSAAHQPRFDDGEFDTLLNPTMVVEVLRDIHERVLASGD
jgi:hypothetical protein